MLGTNTIGVEAVAIKVIEIWQSGGWLMLPLLIVTVFIYYTAFDLLTRLLGHPLLRKPVLGLSNQEITDALNSSLKPLRPIFANDARNVAEVRLHYSEVEKEYLPFLNRRIRFLGALITVSPLMGLLGTVTGMLTTFDGLLMTSGGKLAGVIQGISEALITTQTGLLVAVPGMVLLSLIIQQKNRLRRTIARMERYNTCLVLRLGCPVVSDPRALSLSNQNLVRTPA